MKTRTTVIVLLAVAAGVFAYTRSHNAMPSDFRDAVADNAVDALKGQAGPGAADIKAPEPKAAIPAEGASKAFGSPSQAPLMLSIRAKDGIQLGARGVYMSSSNSLSCTHLSFSDGGMQRLPNVFDKDIPAAVSGETVRFKVDVALTDSCRSQLTGLALRAGHPKIMEEYNRIEVQRTGAAQPALQKILFKKINSPYLGVIWVSGDAQFLVGPDGSASAEVSLQK